MAQPVDHRTLTPDAEVQGGDPCAGEEPRRAPRGGARHRREGAAAPDRAEGRRPRLERERGELLALALATCYRNDPYREAEAQGVEVRSVEGEVEARFGAAGQPARRIGYRTRISADAPDEVVRGLAGRTDAVAKVHNTLRLGMPLGLEGVTVVPATAPTPAP